MAVITTNPATGATRILDFEETTSAQVHATCELAMNAAEDFAAGPLAWRAELLRAMASELEVDAEQLVALADEETALGRPRLEGELRRTCFQFRFFADVVTDGAFLAASIDHAGDSPMGPLPDLRRMKVPLGVVGVFGSSNFPFAFSVPGGDTASALAAGCPVVIKAHPAHPATSTATFRALERAALKSGAPKGTVNLIHGFDAGIALVESSHVSAVGFTGSVPAGRALWQRANARATPIPFYGELGAANPLVVTDRAARERAEEIGKGFAGSMTLGAGQFCTKPGLLFVPTGTAGDGVITALVEALGTVGTFVMLSESVAHNFQVGAASMRSVGTARALVGGMTDEQFRSSARLFEIDADDFVAPGAEALREECFGPAAVVIRYSSSAQLRRALMASERSLTFSVFSGSDDDEGWLVNLGVQRAGRVIVNGFPTGVGVSWSMQHGGPWPSTTSSSATSVGAASIERWLRPVTFQSVSNAGLPLALREENPLGIPRRVDGVQEFRRS
ncbi:MAG: aldehyde dehydrogenase (NADP(+)) [Acidimicrobiales bacterium]